MKFITFEDFKASLLNLKKLLSLKADKSEVEKKADKSDVKHANLAQNDADEPDYVENRTHWSEEVETIIIEKQDVTTSVDGKLNIGVVESNGRLNTGVEYIVEFNGETYVCPCLITDITSNAEQEFSFQVLENSLGTGILKYKSTSETYVKAGDILQIGSYYYYVDIADGSYNRSLQVHGNPYVRTKDTLYKIKDNTVFPRVKAIGNYSIFNDSSRSTPPFLLFDTGEETYLITRTPETYSIGCKTKAELAHKIDSKYIPGASDWAQNDESKAGYIKNKPCYDKLYEFKVFDTFDRQIVDRTYNDGKSSTYLFYWTIKIMDDIYPHCKVEGSNIKGNGYSLSCKQSTVDTGVYVFSFDYDVLMYPNAKPSDIIIYREEYETMPVRYLPIADGSTEGIISYNSYGYLIDDSVYNKCLVGGNRTNIYCPKDIQVYNTFDYGSVSSGLLGMRVARQYGGKAGEDLGLTREDYPVVYICTSNSGFPPTYCYTILTATGKSLWADFYVLHTDEWSRHGENASIYAKKDEVTAQVQADYNQSNTSAVDYIKNRICYDEITDVVLADELYTENELISMLITSTLAHTYYFSDTDDADLPVSVGQTVTVTIDGTSAEHTIDDIVEDQFTVGSYTVSFLYLTGNVAGRTGVIGFGCDTDISSKDFKITLGGQRSLKRIDSKYIPHLYGVCSTASSTAAKVVTISDKTFFLEEGQRITVRFTYANSATRPTLNVNGTGAESIYWRSSVLPSTQYWNSGAVLDFVYTGNYWSLVGVANDNGTNVTVDSALSDSSTNPVQNKAVKAELVKKVTAPTAASVGQVIKVKSIDSDGKILETEAVDLSTNVSITYDEQTGNLQIGG